MPGEWPVRTEQRRSPPFAGEPHACPQPSHFLPPSSSAPVGCGGNGVYTAVPRAPLLEAGCDYGPPPQRKAAASRTSTRTRTRAGSPAPRPTVLKTVSAPSCVTYEPCDLRPTRPRDGGRAGPRRSCQPSRRRFTNWLRSRLRRDQSPLACPIHSRSDQAVTVVVVEIDQVAPHGQVGIRAPDVGATREIVVQNPWASVQLGLLGAEDAGKTCDVRGAIAGHEPQQRLQAADAWPQREKRAVSPAALRRPRGRWHGGRAGSWRAEPPRAAVPGRRGKSPGRAG